MFRTRSSFAIGSTSFTFVRWVTFALVRTIALSAHPKSNVRVTARDNVGFHRSGRRDVYGFHSCAVLKVIRNGKTRATRKRYNNPIWLVNDRCTAILAIFIDIRELLILNFVSLFEMNFSPKSNVK